MVREAEKYRDDDEVNKVKIEAENGSEIHGISVDQERLKFKFEAGHHERSEHDALDQLDKNQLAGKDEFEATQAKLQQHEHDVARGKRQRGKRQRHSKHQAAQEKKEKKEKKEGRREEGKEGGRS